MFTKDDNLLLAAGVPLAFREKIKWTYRTGSAYTCSPPVNNTDIDFYVMLSEPVSTNPLATIFGPFTQQLLGTPWTAVPAKQRLSDALKELTDDGWEQCLDDGTRAAYSNAAEHGELWEAVRLGNYNMMIVVDEAHFYRCAAATELCKALNLMDKGDRITAHSKVNINPEKYIKAPSNYNIWQLVNKLKELKQW